MKAGLWLTLAAAPLVFAFASRSDSQSVVGQVGFVPTGITAEPVLIYDVSGGTLTGPVRQTLTVFNNGSVHYSELSGFPFNKGVSTYASASQEEVRLLGRKLDQAGADTLDDVPLFVSDVPLTTVSFVKNPGTNAKAHSFSFFGGGPGYSDVVGVINAFLAEHGLGSGTSF